MVVKTKKKLVWEEVWGEYPASGQERILVMDGREWARTGPSQRQTLLSRLQGIAKNLSVIITSKISPWSLQEVL